MDANLSEEYDRTDYELLNNSSQSLKASLLFTCIYDSYIKDKELLSAPHFIPALFYFIMTITREDVQVYTDKFEKKMNMKLSEITDTLNKIKQYFTEKQNDINRIAHIMWNKDFKKL